MILDQHDDRFDILTRVTQKGDRMRTASSLTIINVTGFDSNVLECLAMYQVEENDNLSMPVRSVAILSVLG